MRTRYPLCVSGDLVRRLIVGMIAALFLWSGQSADVRAAVAPNGQSGQCGPYYVWYQVGPESALYGGDYVDLCEITFDVSDVIDDFDFVYFTDTPFAKRASLDRNRDGISDQWFFYEPPSSLYSNTESSSQDSSRPRALRPISLITWKPKTGCVRINLRECLHPAFNKNCGYAMINIQPKPGMPIGEAKIPVTVKKKCPPYGQDCSETLSTVQTYSECFASPASNFIIHKKVNPVYLTGYYPAIFSYSIVIRNNGEKEDTILTDAVTEGSNGGSLVLSKIEITRCPFQSRCTILGVSDGRFQISLTGLLKNDDVEINYALTGNPADIPIDEMSYFTNTATLSDGSASQVTVGIRGNRSASGRREERPWER